MDGSDGLHKALLSDDVSWEADEIPPPTYRRAILMVCPVFMGYACLFALQGPLRQKFHMSSMNPTEEAQFKAVYQAGISMLYFGNLIFRMGHNVFFACLIPKKRVHVSCLAMFISMSILSGLTYKTPGDSLSEKLVKFVYLAYFMGGVSIGSFEANILNTITPLGHGTKLWAIAGMPGGVLLITVGGFLVLQADNQEPAAIYLCTCVLLLSTILLLHFALPTAADGHSAGSIQQEVTAKPDRHAPVDISMFWKQLVSWRSWLPDIRWHVLAMSVNMFAVAVSIPLASYLYPGIGAGKHVPWSRQSAGTASSPGIVHDYFMVIFNLCFSVGDMSSRKIFYPTTDTADAGTATAACSCSRWRMPVLHPMWFPTIFSCSGFFMIISQVGWLTPPGALLIAMGNGGLYAQTCYFIDTRIIPEYNLVALSSWLFVGDLGSVIGSNMIDKLT